MHQIGVHAAIADAHRTGWAYVLAAAARTTLDLDLAEECAQEAYASALTNWAEHGVPESPVAWLTTVARRRAIDFIRRRELLDTKLPLLIVGDAYNLDDQDIPDDRLRLIFTCCHPALPVSTRVALTLRLVCGLSTPDVARAFLVSESTMAARITRGKKKIATAGIPYREPAAEELASRVDAVVDVIHLVFTTGHTAPSGSELQRRDLAERGLHLARLLHELLPHQSEPTGLLALVLLTDARREARSDSDGQLLRLSEQDRQLWDHTAIHEGLTLARHAMKQRPPSRYALMAAIAAVHAQAGRWDETDWIRIVDLYNQMVAIWPSPVVALNRAIAIGEALGPKAGLAALDPLGTDHQLSGYHYLPAARADMHRRLGNIKEALCALDEALILVENDVERRFLEQQRKILSETVDSGRSVSDN